MKYIFKYILGNIIFLLSALIPKSKKIWVFGSWGGKQFADNPKYLFNYIYERKTNIKAVWLSYNNDVVQILRGEGKLAYTTFSLKGIWYACRAKVGVVSHGMIDINRFACARLKVVQTWHGIPMKPILLSDPKESTINKRKLLKKLSWIFPFLKKELNFHNSLVICSSSDLVTKILKIAFGEASPIVTTGFPRLDGLFKKSPKNEILEKIASYKDEGLKPGIYMPTWRQKNEFNIIGYLIKNLQNIEEYLNQNNAILFLRIHPFDQHQLPQDFPYKRIHLISNETIKGDIYSILGEFEFLVSDYSSIIFDYLIMTKPIMLLAPDRDEYIDANGGFVYDYKELNLPVFNNWNDLFSSFEENFLPENIDKINVVSNEYHYHNDGNSSERVYNHVVNRMFKKQTLKKEHE